MLSPSIIQSLENIYISPLETCNLACRYCYTKKTTNQLTSAQILAFISRYQNYLASSFSTDYLLPTTSHQLRSVLLCGGEVFMQPDFPKLINTLTRQGLFTTVITNGTIDRLSKFKDPSNCQLLVSLDGPRATHNHNRGKGAFQKSLSFIHHALKLGFPTEILFLVTPNSYPFINSFPAYLAKALRLPHSNALKINYITVKSSAFCTPHSNSGLVCQHPTPTLNPNQILNVKQNHPSLPPRNFGCFQLSLQSNGLIYGCCESPFPLAKLTDPVAKIVARYLSSLSTCFGCNHYQTKDRETLPLPTTNPPTTNHQPLTTGCRGCCAPNFLCGYKTELGVNTCSEVVNLFS